MVWESIKDQNASQYYSVSLQGSRFEALRTLDKNLRGLLFLNNNNSTLFDGSVNYWQPWADVDLQYK